MVKVDHTTRPGPGDIAYVMEHSSDGSILQTPAYCEVLKQQSYRIFNLVLYYDGIPASYILGRYMPRLGIARTMAIGGLVGGCPVVVDGLANRPDVRDLSLKALNEELSGMNVGSIHLSTPPSSPEALPDLLYRNGYGAYRCKHSPVVDISVDKDTLWRTIDRKNRNVIRYAIKNGVTVENDNTLETFHEFYRLYADTANRKQFRPNPFKVMHSQFRILSQNGLADLWVAKKDGETVAGAFIWKYKGTIYYAYGASSKKGWNCKASNLLHWEIITRYGGDGYRRYNMWEGSTDKASPLYDMTAFKLSFGAIMVPTQEYVRVNKKGLNFILSLPPGEIYKKIHAHYLSGL